MRGLVRDAFSVQGNALASDVVEDIAHFGMLGFDGAFVSMQSGDKRSMESQMEQLADAMIALGEARAASFSSARSQGKRTQRYK